MAGPVRQAPEQMVGGVLERTNRVVGRHGPVVGLEWRPIGHVKALGRSVSVSRGDKRRVLIYKACEDSGDESVPDRGFVGGRGDEDGLAKTLSGGAPSGSVGATTTAGARDARKLGRVVKCSHSCRIYEPEIPIRFTKGGVTTFLNENPEFKTHSLFVRACVAPDMMDVVAGRFVSDDAKEGFSVYDDF